MKNLNKWVLSASVMTLILSITAIISQASAQAPAGGSPGAAGAPPAGGPGGPPAGLPPMAGGGGPKPASVDLRVSYPDKVEGIFNLTFANYQGYRPLTLDLYSVPGGAAKPAIVFIHGGGFVGGSSLGGALPPSWVMDKLMAQIAARGYVVVVPNYRLANEAKFPAQLEDSKAAIRWTRANADKYGIDPQRVAIWGESVGGSVAALIGTTCGVTGLEGRGGNANQSSCVQAVVDWYGVTDMAQLDAQAPPNATLIHNSPDSSQSQVLGCVLHECPKDVVQKANPIGYIDASDANVPFLIVHGEADTAVSWKQSQILYDALRAKGVSAKLEVVPGVGHSFQGGKPEQLKSILDMTLDFLAGAVGSGKKK